MQTSLELNRNTDVFWYVFLIKFKLKFNKYSHDIWHLENNKIQLLQLGFFESILSIATFGEF